MYHCNGFWVRVKPRGRFVDAMMSEGTGDGAGSASILLAALVFVAVVAGGGGAGAQDHELQRLVRAYPTQLDRLEGDVLVWRDGTRMAIDDGKGAKTPAQRLEAADLKDMLADPYPAGQWPARPAAGADPGRARNAAFFARMYGDCRKGEVAAHLVDVIWLAGTPQAQRLRVTRINGVARRLGQVSAELTLLPERFRPFLAPAAGGYNCRAIAGTDRVSPHGLGIAVDIATRHADYWQWAKAARDGGREWRNRIPREIVDVFERHGFIWGGRWSAFDTMHFEYRPELLGMAGE